MLLLLADVARQLRFAFDSRARALGVTGSQWRVLLALARFEGPTQSEVADYLDIERITLCRMVDRLGEAGLVERRADPSDRRVWRLHLLPAAHGLVDQLSAIGDELEAEALSHLSPEERDAMRSALTHIRDGLKDRRKAA